MRQPDWSQPVHIELWDLFTCKLYLNWSQPTVGFGQLGLSVERQGEHMVLSGDSETMGPQWCRRALHALADKLADHIPEGGLAGPVRVPIPPEVLAHWKKLNALVAPHEPDASAP